MEVTFDQLASFTTAAAARLAGPSFFAPLFVALCPRAVEGVRQNFDRASAPDGSPWPPLKDPKAGRRPLVKTGALRASVRARPAGDGVLVYSPLPHAAYQHGGTRTIPARPFLGLSAAALGGLAAEVADFAAGRVWGG